MFAEVQPDNKDLHEANNPHQLCQQCSQKVIGKHTECLLVATKAGNVQLAGGTWKTYRHMKVLGINILETKNALLVRTISEDLQPHYAVAASIHSSETFQKKESDSFRLRSTHR